MLMLRMKYWGPRVKGQNRLTLDSELQQHVNTLANSSSFPLRSIKLFFISRHMSDISEHRYTGEAEVHDQQDPWENHFHHIEYTKSPFVLWLSL